VEERNALHLGRVIGTVVATAKVTSLKGQRLLVVEPLDEKGLVTAAPLVAVDTVSAAPGQVIFFVKGREAANALPDNFNPCDAAIVGIPDDVTEDDGGT
jgi:ethanolamine utilization protein EutN